jgi:hypothetical protein
MMTDAEIRKLLDVRAAEPTVLSLYLGVPRDPPALRALPARADQLLARAGRGGSDNPDVAQAQDEGRRIARRTLDVHAREWLGRTIAVFTCAEPRLAETVVLPALADRAVFATRPHVRPLLAAGQRRPGVGQPAAGQRERHPAGPVLPEPGARTVTGLQPCLAAVNQRAVRLLLVPDSGMIPGFVCQRCGQLSSTGTDCPDWGAASLAVPDLIEEMAVTALEDGAQVETIPDPPGGIAARLRFSLVAAGEPPLPRFPRFRPPSPQHPEQRWFTRLAAGNGCVEGGEGR